MDCISVENMRQSDAYTIANFTPSRELMYRAAMGVFLAGSWAGKTAILTGSGNNGGDGFALACILQEQGLPCAVFAVSEKCSADGAFYKEKALAAGVPVLPFGPGCLAGFDTVVDCLLGTGFKGPLREEYRRAIAAANACGAYVISVDINSGMNGDTGEAELAVVSHLTVTIGFVKTGLVSPAAGRYIRRLVCADIGIVLARKEGRICPAGTPAAPGCVPCPPWLDRNILKAY